uniref:Dynein regulatory complex subunit 3 n=2 Tax=Choreotrichia TaxID=141411 RepID=A0A7S3W3S7_9SPIT
MCRRGEAKLRPSANLPEPTDTGGKRDGFRDVRCLQLSYKNVLKIDNLVGFERLVKLQLDNNIIERIENLGHLTTLEWLDLSFNNIAAISGLETLTNLTNLSLFSNRLTEVSGLDTLKDLQVLSLGNNLISDFQSVMYLRPFKKLQAINFVGNPLCQETEYRPYVLAFLNHLKYLDYRLVDEQAVLSAREQYQDQLQDMQEVESQEAAAEEAMAVKAERSSQLTSANVGNIELLKSEMLYEGEGDLAKLRAHPALAACTNEFASYLTEAIEEFVATSIEVHGLKSEEREMFTAALDEAKAENAAEAQAEIAKYNALKKRLLSEAPEGEPLPSAVVQSLNKANATLYETLMELEMSQVERYAESISAFEGCYEELSKRLQEASVAFYNKVRELESAFTQKLEAVATSLNGEEEESRYVDPEERLSDEMKALLNDRETLSNLLNAAHDTRVGNLDGREDETRASELKSLHAVLDGVRSHEFTRNRNRVVEVWNLVHVINKNELEQCVNAREGY